ncbi:MAG: class I SAM-dependent methyltransferase [Parachlamydiales bacterium]
MTIAEAAVTPLPPTRFHELEELKDIPYQNMQTLDRYVGVSLGDLKALSILIKSSNAKNCLELGTFLGTGTTALFYGAGVNLICVDHWKGNEFDPFMQSVSPKYDLFAICSNNVKQYDHENRIILLESDSLQASKQFPDHTFDLIFIDADHTYEGVLADLKVWYSKVKPGGIICGHDCEGRPKNFPFYNFSDWALKGKDWDDLLKIHPGVMRAVDEFFHGQALLFAEQSIIVNGTNERSSIWYYRIPE